MQKPPPPRRFGIGDLAILIAGITIGFWLLGIGSGAQMSVIGSDAGMRVSPYGAWVGVLGGLSVVGPPLLILARRRHKRKFGPGELMWFSQGTSAWLLWPPIVYHRVQTNPPGGPIAGPCFAYGTPLMALYLGSALLFGGWIRKRRRCRARSWQETFGLILGVFWACTGGYALYIIWSSR